MPTTTLHSILAVHGWRPEFLRAADTLAPAPLFPGQERLLLDTGIARGESALVLAPTGSGKSLLGAVGMLAACVRGRAGMVLLPTRALAAEAAARLEPAAKEGGLRLALSTREARSHDAAIREGRVDLVVAVYEKGLALLRDSALFAARLGALVLDEAQILLEHDRGPTVEAGLLPLLDLPGRPALIALAAHVPAAETLAAWMRIPIFESRERPIPLREGVVDLESARILWRAPNGGHPVAEASPFPPAPADPERGDAHSRAVLAIASDAGRTLLFVPTRRLAWAGAEALARAGGMPVTELATILDALPHDLARRQLEPLLAAGIGVHTSELPRAHRAALEGAFRSGHLRLLVSTPTLAQGVNLGADLVLHSPLMAASRVEGADNALVPLGRAQFLNAGGRAGRPGGAAEGRSIVLARSPEEQRCLADALFGPGSEPTCDNAIGARPMLLDGLAQLFTREGAADMLRLRRLVSARLVPMDDFELELLLTEGVRLELWRTDGSGEYHLTPAGRVLARGGGRGGAISRWAKLLWGSADEASPLTVLTLACEGLPGSFQPAGARGMRSEETTLWRRLRAAPDALGRARSCMAPPGPSVAWRVDMLETLSGPGGMREVEERFQLLGGTIEDLAAEGAHQLGLLEELATELRRPAIADLARRLRRLFTDGDAEDPADDLPAAAPPVTPTRAPSLRLEMLAGSTGIVRFDGRRIVLSPMQHAMLVALVEHLDAGVSYRELTERLWPDAQVEQQQLFYHRRQLEKALLGRPAEPAGELIETRDKWGFVLRLPPSEISIVHVPRRTRAA